MPRSQQRRRTQQEKFRILLASSALCSALFVAAAGFMNWMSVVGSDFAQGLTVTGWGVLGGTGELAGSNINMVLDELGQTGSYRQAQLPTVLAGLALIPAIWLIFTLSKFAAAALGGLGVFILLWGGFRGLYPGNLAGILEPGEAHAAIGPWMVLLGGVVMLAVGVVVLLGGATPQPQPVAKRARGIQP